MTETFLPAMSTPAFDGCLISTCTACLLGPHETASIMAARAGNRIFFIVAKSGLGLTHEKLFRSLEMRLDALVYRAGFAPTIFAAKQIVNHGHILVDGKRVDRSSCVIKEGQVITIDAAKSPAAAEAAKKSNSVVPPYMEVDLDNLKATLVRAPQLEEIPVPVKIMSVVEYYAR